MYKYLGFLDGILYKVKMRRKLYKKVLLNTIKARNGFQTKNLRKQYINLPLESQNTAPMPSSASFLSKYPFIAISD